MPAGFPASRANGQVPGLYQVSKTIHVGGDGGFDYAKIDDDGKLLYFPRTGHTQVVDTSAGKIVADIVGGGRLHGTALAPDAGRGFITDGTAGAVIIFEPQELCGARGTIAPENARRMRTASSMIRQAIMYSWRAATLARSSPLHPMWTRKPANQSRRLIWEESLNS